MGLKTYAPTGIARLRPLTKAFSDGVPTAIASEDFELWIYRGGVEARRAVQLSRGTTDTQVQSTAFYFSESGDPYARAAVAAGTAFAAQTITADNWAGYLAHIDTAGVITLLPFDDNVTPGYANEAAVLADIPATPVNEYAMGIITVQTMASTNWVAATDALAGGSTGNPAATTNYYTIAEQLVTESPPGALTFGEDTYGTGSHEFLVDAALAGAGADASGVDEVEIILASGTTVDSVSVTGDPFGIFGVAIDGLTAGVGADVETRANAGADTAFSDYHGAPIDDAVNDPGGAATTVAFQVDTTQGAKVLYGTLRFTSGALAGEKRVVKWTGTSITVLGDPDMDSAERQFSAPPANNATFTFIPGV